jgi:hypothetical protein
MIISNAKGPATAPTVPSHGSNQTQVDMKMNSTTDTTAAASVPAPITIAEIQAEYEAIWSDLSDLQRKSYLLMGCVEDGLSISRAKEVNGDTVTLMFQKRGIDVAEWLAGQVWSDAANILKKADSLYDRLGALS